MVDESSRVFVVPIACGEMEENAFLYADETTKEAFLIDPGAEPDKLIRALNEHGLTLRGILLTHGHFDHIGAVTALSEVFHVPVYAFHDSELLSDPYMNLSARFGKPIVICDYTSVSDGTIIKLSDSSPATLRVIAAPGHTPDSILFYDEVNGICFSGDTIFKGTYGNYMLPGGDRQTLLKTLRDVVLTLPETTRLYSGHTDMTTIGEEKKNYRW